VNIRKQGFPETHFSGTFTALVKMTLLYHRSMSAIHTTIAMKRVEVTLSGNAKNTAEKDLMINLVKDVKGVKSVKNRMTIG
jgi:osmotically-inducible protein OsmY